jgi:hypothetical protein
MYMLSRDGNLEILTNLGAMLLDNPMVQETYPAGIVDTIPGGGSSETLED